MAREMVVPWHKVVALRDDLRSGELALSVFAADLYDVAMGRGRSVYRDPAEFFALTYPTLALRDMVRDVLLRLAGKNAKAVRQLELTYGGGKTHSLITLYHLVNDPASLPDLPSVHEFRQHAGGLAPPRARVAVLAFDKLDVEKGMAVRSLAGRERWLRHPWSVLAYQIAGDDGLRLLHAEDRDEERESPPAENLLEELLAIPAREGLATLVLIDEVLMYAREKIGFDQAWRGRLMDFFQCLTQSATKVDRCCVVASLLATDNRKSDALGKEILQELSAVLRREKEEGVQPVGKEDVAEVLRRRFFTPESMRDRERFRPQVLSALEGIQALDDITRKDRQAQEERYRASYPFHPDLTETLYSKWTQLEGFQKTRGVLRIFAMALRDAESWDASPLIGPNVLLSAEGKAGLSEAARELASIASAEEYEGKRQEWSAILEGELSKVRELQQQPELRLRGRELEQAVIATFLHSQPIGKSATSRDLLVLLGASRPDRILLEEALRRWTDVSWFLDESAFSSTEGKARELPKSWRLGTNPNLKQMHSQALGRVAPDLVEMTVRDLIAKEKRLTAGPVQAGVKVHNLPQRPADVQDDGDFHFVLLGPSAVSEPGKPSAEARRFVTEKTGPESPRVYQNAMLLAVPSRDGLENLRARVRDYLAWQDVAALPEAREMDDRRRLLLKGYGDQARNRIPESIVQAYNIVVTLSDKGELQALRLTTGGEPLFDTVQKDGRCRIHVAALNPEALSPSGPPPWGFWQHGETARPLADFVIAFARYPHLPKMLRRQEIIDTVALGCKQGWFVLRMTRPDTSVRTLWRVQPGEVDMKEPGLEVVLPEAAELKSLDSSLLCSGALPGLWPEAGAPLAVKGAYDFFDGQHAVRVPGQGYEDVYPVPRADREVVDHAIAEAIKGGLLWLLSGPASIFKEDIPLGVLAEAATLNPPPPAIAATSVLPQNLPAAWAQQVTTAAGVAAALSAKDGRQLPWATVSAAIDGAMRGRLIERTDDSGPWPCDWPGATAVRLRLPTVITQPPAPPPPGRKRAEARLDVGELQDVVEGLGEIMKAGAGLGLQFVLRIEIPDESPDEGQIARLNEALGKASSKLKLE